MAFEKRFESGDKAEGNEKITYEKGNVKLVLQQDECFPDEPGQGTPAMVYLRIHGEVVSSTYWCCMDEGDIEGYTLSESIMEWLETRRKQVDRYLDEWYELAEKAGK